MWIINAVDTAPAQHIAHHSHVPFRWMALGEATDDLTADLTLEELREVEAAYDKAFSRETTVQERLDAIRHGMGWTDLDDMAQHCGIDRTALDNAIDSNVLDAITAQRIRDCTGCRTGWVLYGTEPALVPDDPRITPTPDPFVEADETAFDRQARSGKTTLRDRLREIQRDQELDSLSALADACGLGWGGV